MHRVLQRYGCPPLTHLNRATGRPVRRYGHNAPCDLVHVDVKKLGNIPDGGGHRVHGRAIGRRNSSAHRDPDRPRTTPGRPNLGYGYLHTAIDDHCRLAYTEILPDERQQTAAAFWQRAQQFFASCGITARRVLTDNGSCYRSRLRRDTLAAAAIAHKRTRPFRSQTNGKVEHYHRTLLDEWAYARPYASESEHRAALAPWLHMYNHHRGHTALGGLPPASRVTNLSGQNT
ncbi:IS481 family transposase [Actinomadura sp. SCN-SB]|uniref:IS481 family transposase n=1 Tax=Actinomadura sp. SCN-SB TaxID=3373092 RepID=UPI003750D46D